MSVYFISWEEFTFSLPDSTKKFLSNTDKLHVHMYLWNFQTVIVSSHPDIFNLFWTYKLVPFSDCKFLLIN